MTTQTTDLTAAIQSIEQETREAIERISQRGPSTVRAAHEARLSRSLVMTRHYQQIAELLAETHGVEIAQI